MSVRSSRVLALALAATVCSGTAISQVTDADLFVDAKAPGNQSGIDWYNAMPTPQDAIDHANAFLNGDVHIVVAEGTYFPTTAQWNLPNTGYTSRDTTIVLKTSLNGGQVFLHGGYEGCDDDFCLNPGTIDYSAPDGSFDRTILSGDIPGPADYHHVLVADADQNLGYLFGRVIVDGFKVVGGRADVVGKRRDSGGGFIYEDEADVRLEHMTFEDNIAIADGGALYGAGKAFSVLEIAHTTFQNNIAKRGGAVGLNILRDVRMANVHFKNNGNMVQDISGFPPVTKKGGAIFTNEEVKIVCQNGLFHDNTAQQGGTVYVIPIDYSKTGDYRHTWRNCTFAYNAVPGTGLTTEGAGFDVQADAANNGADTDVHFYNCIFWRNGIGVDILLGANMNAFVWNTNWDQNTVASMGVFNQVADTSVNPQFKNAAARNLRLRLSSTLIDAGNTALIGLDILDVDENGDSNEALPWDLDLGTRVNGAAVDMGAYETTSGQ
jgi:predicted outer membrane repeat protein